YAHSGSPLTRPALRARARCPGRSRCPRRSRARGDPRVADSHALPLAATEVPAIAEKIEMDRPARMSGDHVLVERDAKTRPRRQRERSIADRGDSPGRLADERIDEVIEVLEDLEVGHRGRQVERRCGRNRTTD